MKLLSEPHKKQRVRNAAALGNVLCETISQASILFLWCLVLKQKSREEYILKDVSWICEWRCNLKPEKTLLGGEIIMQIFSHFYRTFEFRTWQYIENCLVFMLYIYIFGNELTEKTWYLCVLCITNVSFMGFTKYPAKFLTLHLLLTH